MLNANFSSDDALRIFPNIRLLKIDQTPANVLFHGRLDCRLVDIQPKAFCKVRAVGDSASTEQEGRVERASLGTLFDLTETLLESAIYAAINSICPGFSRKCL